MTGFDRRHFMTSATVGATVGAAAATAAMPAPAQAAPLPPLKAKLGHEVMGILDEKMALYLRRFGVDGLGTAPIIVDPFRIYPTADELKRMRDLAEKHQMTMEIAEAFLPTQNVDNQDHPAINLGEGDQRDRDIDAFHEYIRACAAAGVPTIKYALNYLGAIRTSYTYPGRGDALQSGWRLADAPKDLPLTRAGTVDADLFWERITYFLDRVVPVASEYKVRIALHPHDPGVPPAGYRGIQRVLGTVDGVKRFVQIRDNPYHGLNFCQGTMSEMLADPGKEIYDVIEWFGSRNKIFNVHFRNIRGHRDDFVETFPDEGDVDFVKALKVYRKVGYDRLLMPDHAASIKNDPRGHEENFAFAFGYIRGLIQSESHVA